MLKFKSVLAITGVAIVLLCGRYAMATLIVQYTFDGGTKKPFAKSPEITASDFGSLNNTIVFVNGNPSSGKAVEDTGWKDSGNYFYYSLTPSEGYRLNLTNLTFDHKKENSGAKRWDVTYRVGSTGAFTNVGNGSADNVTWISANDNLSGITALQNTANTIYFRIVASEASNNGKKWDLDNVTLTGDVLMIPEPTTIAILALGGLMLRRPRQR